MKILLVFVTGALAFASRVDASFNQDKNQPGEIISSSMTGGTSVLPDSGGDRTGIIHTIRLNSWRSIDLLPPAFGAQQNQVMVVRITAGGAPVTINGIGWATTQKAFQNPNTGQQSWLSEMGMYLDEWTGVIPPAAGHYQTPGPLPSDGIYLRPGAGSNFPGTANFSSGGIINLPDVGIQPLLLPNGYLRIEFYETFNDFNNSDGRWWGDLDVAGSGLRGDESGFLYISVIPTPGSFGLFGLAALGSLRRRRRKIYNLKSMT